MPDIVLKGNSKLIWIAKLDLFGSSPKAVVVFVRELSLESRSSFLQPFNHFLPKRCCFCARPKKMNYSATTSTKATQENFLQTSQWESHIGTMDFHKINYVWQIYPLSKHNKIQIAAILLFHHSNAVDQFVKNFLGCLGWSSCTVKTRERCYR